MIKFLLGVAIVAFFSFCGHLLAKKYRQRSSFFKQFKEFNERFLSEIAYYRRPLKDFVTEYAYEGEFGELLKDYFSAIDDRTQVEFLLSQRDKYSFLNEDERRTVEDYFLMLGKGDSTSQKGYFGSVKEKLTSLRSEAESAAKRYGDLYVKLGFLFGLLILILIV